MWTKLRVENCVSSIWDEITPGRERCDLVTIATAAPKAQEQLQMRVPHIGPAWRTKEGKEENHATQGNQPSKEWREVKSDVILARRV